MDFEFVEGKNEPGVDFYEIFQYGDAPSSIKVTLRGSRDFCEFHKRRIKFALPTMSPEIVTVVDRP